MTIVIKKGDSKEHMEKLLKTVSDKKTKSPQQFDASKFCGTVKLNEDPLAIQEKLRDEWS